MWIKIDIIGFLDPDKIQCFLWFTAQCASEPLHFHQLVQYLQILRFWGVQTQTNQNDDSDMSVRPVAFWTGHVKRDLVVALLFSLRLEFSESLVIEEI
jgi:hypothetical protein